MSLGDSIGYLIFGNPISQSVIHTASALLGSIELKPKAVLKEPVVTAAVAVSQLPLWQLAGSNYNFIRLAGLSGAAAVIMGAYGKHNLARIKDTMERMEAMTIFETANRFHFLHSFALMAVVMANKPVLTGSLMAAGTILFSGPMYYRALTGDKTFVQVATCGGFCLIAAWLSLVF